MSMPIDSSFLEQVLATLAMDHLVLDIQCCYEYAHDKFKFVDDLLYFEEGLYTLEGSRRLEIPLVRYDFLVDRHFQFNKTLEVIFQDFL